ncbi:MAG TPA: hypothetical protein PKC65_01855 [Pyrinomonadaceae bacterium]|nr:hypothetical protein [Pyrinomonadaceae bacterium]
MIEVVSDHTGILSISELIDDIKSSSTWMIFRNLEQLPTYKRIMEELLEDLTCELGIAASDCLRPMCFAFVSSPSVRVPLHIDPEHNFLFQVSGSKSVYLNRHEKDPIVSPTQIAAFYADEVGFSLSDATVDEGKFEKFYMTPSSGVYIPVTSPHYVINDEKVAVSFSVTFRSISSDEHRDRHLRMLQNHS